MVEYGVGINLGGLDEESMMNRLYQGCESIQMLMALTLQPTTDYKSESIFLHIPDNFRVNYSRTIIWRKIITLL